MNQDPMFFWLSAATGAFVFFIILYFVIKWAVAAGTSDLLHAMQTIVSTRQAENKVQNPRLPPSVASLKKLLDNGMIDQAEYDHAVSAIK